uniref:Regulatory protein HrpB n=1 Tax=Ralstonia solanacearum TaxID=305 RepID=U6C0E2_RALSL|nr:regulatory protein HrpB [Ralstonia solanacearum]
MLDFAVAHACPNTQMRFSPLISTVRISSSTTTPPSEESPTTTRACWRWPMPRCCSSAMKKRKKASAWRSASSAIRMTSCAWCRAAIPAGRHCCAIATPRRRAASRAWPKTMARPGPSRSRASSAWRWCITSSASRMPPTTRCGRRARPQTAAAIAAGWPPSISSSTNSPCRPASAAPTACSSMRSGNRPKWARPCWPTTAAATVGRRPYRRAHRCRRSSSAAPNTSACCAAWPTGTARRSTRSWRPSTTRASSAGCGEGGR